ncbi:nudix hydrolase 17, mitochondrial-like [Magnolia sinica]|uniref:nudix hydrolase 17, mitochondrial-like n=1 Tax=Magnolia sinica TaxID=86752 RepID=UPI00265B3049|nr:nudix hydrolase 17, mitochondrial-like [Magnolia sinica]
MVALVARTGRELQRYSNGRRLVVGCIPYRLKPNNDDIDESMEVLVISSQKGQGTMFPKGGWEVDETMEAAAHREALEEAGVIGDVEDSLGQWSFVSKRYGTYYEGYVFPLRVTEILDQWPEDDVRKRRWVTVAEARENCQHWWMKEALDKLVDHLSNPTSYSPCKNRERQDIPC